MDKDQILERAAYNGKKCAECYFDKDYRMGNSYSTGTRELARTYPTLRREIQSAHTDAYNEFMKTHKH